MGYISGSHGAWQRKNVGNVKGLWLVRNRKQHICFRNSNRLACQTNPVVYILLYYRLLPLNSREQKPVECFLAQSHFWFCAKRKIHDLLLSSKVLHLRASYFYADFQILAFWNNILKPIRNKQKLKWNTTMKGYLLAIISMNAEQIFKNDYKWDTFYTLMWGALG